MLIKSFVFFLQKKNPGCRVHTHKYASCSPMVASTDPTVMLFLMDQLLQWINEKVWNANMMIILKAAKEWDQSPACKRYEMQIMEDVNWWQDLSYALFITAALQPVWFVRVLPVGFSKRKTSGCVGSLVLVWVASMISVGAHKYSMSLFFYLVCSFFLASLYWNDCKT
jgi:hypothetical protein